MALLCPGLGRTYRGYERFASELFDAVASRANVTLFRGSDASRRGEENVGGLSRHSRAAKFLARVKGDVYYWEALTFALRAGRRLRSFDLIHYSEPPLNLAFSRIWRGGMSPRRIFSHALNMSPEHTLRCHHIHQASPDGLEAARNIGVPDDRMTLIPYGVDTSSYRNRLSPDDRARVRRELGLPADGAVVLSVAAVNRAHKRIDVLIDAVARVVPRPHLVLAGALEEPDLLESARQALGPGSVTHVYVGNEFMPKLYGAADVFVLASAVEGFGLAPLEAQLSGLPVIVNDVPHFRWLLGPQGTRFVDIAEPASIADALGKTLSQLGAIMDETRASWPAQSARFDWRNVIPLYLDMYTRAAGHDSMTIEEILAA